MSAGHTPRPWTVVPQASIMDQDGAILLGCNHHEIRPAAGQKLGDEMADLTLAAAAPELLAALQGLLNALPSATSHPAIQAARAAIAKATGSAS